MVGVHVLYIFCVPFSGNVSNVRLFCVYVAMRVPRETFNCNKKNDIAYANDSAAAISICI